MAIDIAEVKRLKDLTGVGLTDAKAALEEANGDFDKALEAMRKKGMTKAEKRGEREARQGLVGTYNHDSRIGKDVAMHIAASAPEYVSSEDISEEAREAKKQELLASDALTGKPAEMAAQIVEGQLKKYFAERCLLDQPFIKNPDQTVGDYVKEHNARLGENILVRRFNRIALGEVA
jgi:elongation factor Ts